MARMTKEQKAFADLVAAESVKIGTALKEGVTRVLEQVDVGPIIADNDPGWTEAEITDMAESAASYLTEQFVGALCWNALDPKKYAAKTLSTAYDQLRSAAEIAEEHPSPASDAQVENRLKWVVQQLMQQKYRPALVNVAMGAFHHAFEKPYQVRKPATEQNRTGSTEAAKKILKAAASK